MTGQGRTVLLIPAHPNPRKISLYRHLKREEREKRERWEARLEREGGGEEGMRVEEKGKKEGQGGQPAQSSKQL